MPQIAGPTCEYRVVQIHPLLRCNLRCLHCYSTSSPEAEQSLPLARLTAALEILRQEGFNAVGISGGEPLLYPDLPALLQHIRGLGMTATVTTNGMLLNEKRTEFLQQADLVAISLDGMPESHNRVRNNPRAFESMAAGVEHLRRAGIPFGFIFTLTFHNLHEIDWVAEYAVTKGASLLQIHPLEEVGRATTQFHGGAPDGLELARGFIEVARLRLQYGDRITLQYDVADGEILRANPERGYAVASPAACGISDPANARLADLIAPIIIEADGAIVPIQYNFSRAFQIGDIYADCLSSQLAGWKQDSYSKFLALCRDVHSRLLNEATPDLPFANWYGTILQASHSWDALAQAV
jgi:MoaA/NifB/PqqE/SkfB family radical SAM enzyme